MRHIPYLTVKYGNGQIIEASTVVLIIWIGLYYYET